MLTATPGLIEQYRILHKLGEGRLGTVHKGLDLNLDRPVALKFLNSDLTHRPELLERFRSEARTQATLEHPNLAMLYAFLVWQGAPVLVMEYVEGETFQNMIARCGPIPCQTSLPLFQQALLGIGAAHSRGMMHRDLKPANIMLNKAGCVKTMDFGIANVLGIDGAKPTHVRMGTSWYMAPEQVLNRPVDLRTDVYALGVTLYEMLAGRVPFDAPSEYEIQRAHVQATPPPPTLYYPDIPSPLVSAVMRALSKDPGQRFACANEFGAALDLNVSAPARLKPLSAHVPFREPPPVPLKIAPRMPLLLTKRNKQVLGSAGSLIAAAGLAVLVVANNSEQEHERERDRVVRERQGSVLDLVERVKRESAPAMPLTSDIARVNGIWRGTYLCGPSLNQMQLEIAARSTEDISAVVRFAVPNSPPGAYRLRGTFSPEANRLNLTFAGWKDRPPSAVPANIAGVLGPDGRRITGSILAPGCGVFTVRR